MRSSFAPSVHIKHCFGLEEPQQEGGFWRSLLLPLALILLTRHFLLEARYIPSGSMLPGLQLQDRLMVEKLSSRQRSPRRGEIIVFNAPQAFDPALKDSYRPGPLQCFFVNLPIIGALAGLQAPACDAYIKRVVAIAGDQVVVDPSGKIQINGKKVFEPYVSNYCSSSPCKSLQTVVPAKSVLVLGDNRANSWDGRFWPGTNFVPEDQIIGRALFRFWPLNRFGSLLHPDPSTKPVAPATQ